MTAPAPRGRLREALEATAARLAAAGVEAARFEARVLAAHALGCEPADIVLRLDDPLPGDVARCLEELVRRRADREPLQYVLGWAEFYSRRFTVTPAVLIPRPETELLVEAVIEHVRRTTEQAGSGSPPCAIADLGTGSGAIAVTLAAELPGARVWATDLSPAALEVAAANARQHAVAERVTLLAGSWGEPLLAAGCGGTFEVVAANPPYVAPEERDRLPPEVRAEPELAVVAPGHALAAYQELIPQAAELLRPGGMLALEVAPHRARAVRRLLADAGWCDRVEVGRDYAGLERVVLGWRKAR